MSLLYTSAWRRRRDDAREAARLQLVALASEVAVLAALVDEHLTSVRRGAEARALLEICWEKRRLALETLSPEADLHRLPASRLENACTEFQRHLREVAGLRQQAHARVDLDLQ